MAGAGYKLFNTGDVLTAAQVNTYLNEQTVMVFANSTARTTALSGVLAEGMVSYLQDTNAVEVYNGSAWVGVSGAGDVTEVQAGTGISVASGTGPIPVVTNTMATAVDAKGDLIVGTGADTFARLAVGGTNGHSLQVDSSTATGLKWAAPAASSAGLNLISTTTLSASGSFNITGIFSATYKNYIVLGSDLISSTANNFLIGLRNSGGNAATSYAYWQYRYTYAGSNQQGTQTNGSYALPVDMTTTSADSASFILQLNNPFETKATGFEGSAMYYHSASKVIGQHQQATSYTDLFFTVSTGTVTGNISVYGYGL
jgi:hypothetical protein